MKGYNYSKRVKTPEEKVQYFCFLKDQVISLKWLEVCKEGTSIATTTSKRK